MKKLKGFLIILPIFLLMFGCKKKENNTTKENTTIITTKDNITTDNTTTAKQDTYFEIKFLNYDNSILSTKNVKEGDMPVYDGNTPIKPSANNGYAYRFVGWDSEISAANSNKTYVAQYELYAIDYSITYVLNGGDNNTNNPTTYNADMDNINLLDPEKTGNEFKGWILDNELITEIDTSLASNLTIEASWETDKHDVIVNKNITNAGTINGTGKKEYNQNVELTATTNKGYTFLGFFNGTTELGETYSFTMPDNDVEIDARWSINSYTLTLDNDNPTFGSVTGGGTYEYLSEVTIIATANTGYNFLGWYKNNQLVDNSSTYSFDMYNEDTILTAKFAISKYSVNIEKNISEAGTISGSGTYDFNGNVTISAATNTGYTFLGFYNGESLFCVEAEKTFAMPANNLALTAKYEINKYNIIASHNIDNSYKFINYSTSPAEYNSNVSFETQPNNGYSFFGWYVDGSFYTDESSFSIKMPAHDLEVKAVFSINSYNVNLIKNINDSSISISGSGTYNYLSSVTVTTSNTEIGYSFDGWYIGTECKSHDTSYTFEMGYEALTLEAKYSCNSYNITINNDTNKGTIYGHGIHSFKDEITLIAEAKPGYSFVGWYDEENEVSNESSYSFIMPHNNITYEARYSVNSYAVLLRKGIVDEAITLDGGGYYAYLSEVTVSTSNTEIGYSFDGWYIGEECKTNNPTYTFTMVAETIELFAKYNYNSYTITILYNDEMGTVTGETICNFKSKASLTAEPNDYFRFIGWYSGETMVSYYNNCEFSMPHNDVTLEAIFDYKEYNLSLTKNINVSTITISGDGSHKYDSSVTITTSTTEEGYAFNGWYDGETLVSPLSTYTFKMPHNNYSLEAVYDYNEYELTLTTDTTKGTVTGENTYSFDSYVTVVAEATTGYEFVGWYDGDNIVSNLATYAFKMPHNNLSLEGRFDLKSYYISVTSSNCEITGNGYKKYSSEVTLTVTPYLGYQFNGWYDGETLVSPLSTYTFTMPSNNLYYEARISVQSQMSNFTFTSTKTTCEITGVVSKSVTSIVVPDFVTSIKARAFNGCSSLASLTLPFIGKNKTDTNPIGYVFGSTSYSSSYEISFIPEGSYVYETYYIPNSLKTITITGSTYIPEYAFYKLNITTLNIPSSIAGIGNGAFKNVSTLTTVSYDGTVSDWCKITFNNAYSNPMNYATSFTFVQEEEQITDTLTIPSDITNVLKWSFYGFKGVTKIIVPINVTSVGKGAFACPDLVYIKIPFAGQQEYKTDDNEYFAEIFGDVSFTNAVEIAVTSYSSLYAPKYLNTIELYNCSCIQSKAFYKLPIGCLIMDDSIKTVGGAFTNCDKLSNIFYKGTIKDWCNISYATNYTLSSVDSLYNPMRYAKNFYLYDENGTKTDYVGCTYSTVVDLVIPSGVTTIKEYKFSNFQQLKTVVVPDTVTYIGEGAFSGCSALTSITLPFVGEQKYTSTTSTNPFGYIFGTDEYTGGTSTSQGTTYYIPTTLKTVIITGGTILPKYAFRRCSNITKIVLPSTLTKVDSYALANLSATTKILFNGTSTQWNNIDLASTYDDSSNITVYYYSETQATGCWHYVDGVPTIWS